MPLNPYATNPAAAATNENAQGLFRRTGKMPKTTVGGLFGQAFPDPAKMAPRNLLTTTGNSIGAQGQVQANLGGLFGMNSATKSPEAGPGLFFRPTQYGSDAPTSTPLPAAPPGYSEPLGARSRQAAGIGPSAVRPLASVLAGNKASYAAARNTEMAGRNEGVLAKAQGRAAARGLAVDLRRHPEATNMLFGAGQEANLQGLVNQGAIGVANANAAGTAAKTEAGQRRDSLAAIVGLVQGNVPLEKAQQIVGGGLGGSVAAQPKSPAEAPKIEDLKKLSPEERQIALKDFHPATRKRLMEEIDRPSFAGQVMGGSLNYGLSAADAVGSGIGSLFGYKPEPKSKSYYAPWNNSPAAQKWRAEMERKRSQARGAGGVQYPREPNVLPERPSTNQAR